MEIVLLVLAAMVWVFIRRQDRAEMEQHFAHQDAEISRLRDEVSALRRAGVMAAAQAVGSAAVSAVATPPASRSAGAEPVVTPKPEPASSIQGIPIPPMPSGPPVERPASAAVPPPWPAAPAMAPPTAPSRPGPTFERTVPVPSFGSVGDDSTRVGERKSLEHRVGVNWLSRLGVVLLVFGVALFLAYQLTHFGPVGKVITAYAVSVALLCGGLWLERKERSRIFGRAGIGGGWALGFFTTYAMYHVPATKVLESQGLDLVLLLAVGVGMVVHSLRYRSQVVTGLAFLLAFSTVTISQVTAFSLLASAVLALGLEVVCVREAWYVLEMAGVAAAYGNHFLWLERAVEEAGGPGHPFALWGDSTALLVLFWAIFRAGYCVRKPADERAEGLSGLVAVANSAGFLLLMKYQSFHPEWAFWALVALGSVEMSLAFVMRGRRRPAFSVLLTIASVLLLAAIPLRFGGATWPLLWTLEGETLFLCGMALKEPLMKWLGSGTLLLVTGQLLAMHADAFIGERTPGAWKIALAFFSVAAAMWVNAEWLGRGDVAEDVAGDSGATNSVDPGPFEALLAISSIAAAGCAAIGIWILVPGWTLVLWWALLAFVLMEAGVRARSLWLRMECYGVMIVALARLVIVNFAETHEWGFGDVRLWAGAVMVAACVLLQERLRRSGESVPAEEKSVVSWLAMWVASALVSGLLYMELLERWLAAGWAGFALLLAAFALVRDGSRVRSKALVLAGMTAVRAIVVNLGYIDGLPGTASAADWGRVAFFTATGLLALAIPIGFVLRRRKLPAGKGGTSIFVEAAGRPEQVFFFATLTMLVLWVPVDFHQGAMTMVWSGMGVAIFLMALAVGERSFRLSGLGLLLLGVAKLLIVDVWGLAPAERYLLLIGVGMLLLLVSFLYSRFGDRLKEYL